MLRLVRPTDDRLRDITRRAADREVTYGEVGATRSEPLPSGYHHVRVERVLGRGDEAFAKGVAGLREWAPQRGSGLSVVADGPIVAGTTVAIAAPLPVAFAIATCRIVYVEDDLDHFAFAYGTLPLHPERGEERFEIARVGDAVTFRIVAFSRPQQLLSRMGAPVARRLRRRATARYLDAMTRACS